MEIRRTQSWERFANLGIGGGDVFAAARRREDTRWKRARSLGILGTALLHILILLLVRNVDVEPMEPTAAAGPAAGDLRAAAGGGSGMTMVEVRPEQAPPEEETPEPVPVPDEVIIPQEIVVAAAPVPAPAQEPISAPSLPGTGGTGAGGQDGPATGPGTETGTGDGGGGTGDGGGESRIVLPRPRGIFIPPPGRPESARGREITVWVFVMANGRVDGDQTRLEPPTSDSRYNRRLMQSVGEWVFDPGREDGRPVPTWYPFQIIL